MAYSLWQRIAVLQGVVVLSWSSMSPEVVHPDIIPLSEADLVAADAHLAESERAHGDVALLYPGMLEAQRIGEDLFRIVRHMPSAADTIHMDSRLMTPDSAEIGLDLKYMNDCLVRLKAGFNTASHVHPLVHEYRFIGALRKSGLVPPHVRISPAVRDSGSKEVEYKHGQFSTTIERKFSFSGLPDHQKCNQVGAETRFLSFDDIGIPVASYFDFASHIFTHEADRLIAIMSFGIQALRIVQKLHAYGVVHGGLNAASIRFRHERETWPAYDLRKDYLIFVDLQSSFLFRETESIADYTVIDSPPWHLVLRGLPKSRRDDVYAMAETLVNLVTEERLRARFEEKKGNIPELVELKQSYDMFDKKGISYHIGLGSPRHSLGREFLKTVRALKEDDEPPYDMLIKKLEEIVAALQKDRTAIISHIFG